MRENLKNPEILSKSGKIVQNLEGLEKSGGL